MEYTIALRSPCKAASLPPWVRRIGRLPLAAGLLSLLLLLSCVRQSEDATVRCESLKLPFHRYGPSLSAVVSSANLAIAFTDRENASLNMSLIPLKGPWNASSPSFETVDRIDWANSFSVDFGSMLLAVDGSRENLFYLDREREGEDILKWAYRRAGTDPWSVDTFVPPGRPLAFVPDADGRCGFYWMSDGIYRTALSPLPSAEGARPASLSGDPMSVHKRILFDGTAMPVSSGGRSGFTAYDADTDSLSFWEWKADHLDETRIPGGSRIQASRLRPDGTLAILLYEARTRRIVFKEQTASPKGFRETGVTLADGTTALFFLEGKEGTRFFFTELVEDGHGGTQAALSLLHKVEGEYRKRVLSSEAGAIRSLSIVESGGEIYAVLLRDTIEALRIRIE